MRGGTSKCVVLRADDIPPEGPDRDLFLLRLMGSPDPRQIDGLGGATSTTSKVVLVRPSAEPDVDVDYTFAQVSVPEAAVDYRGNCGNCASAVGPFAITEGLVALDVPLTLVRIRNTNTGKLLVAEVATDVAGPVEAGDFTIAGVPGTGALQTLWFHEPQGTAGMGLLPSGNALDTVPTAIGPVRVSFVDAANPVVFAAAEDLGLSGTEVTPLEVWPHAIRLALEEVRGFAATILGLVPTPGDAARLSRNIPKVGLVTAPAAYQDIYGRDVAGKSHDICARILSMGTLHPAFALTGAMALAAAVGIPGSLPASVLTAGVPDVLRIGHPSGVLSVRRKLESPGSLAALGVERTARRLFVGDAYVPLQPPNVRRASPHIRS